MKAKTQILFQVAFLLAFTTLKSQTLTCQNQCPKIGELFSIKTASPPSQSNGQNQMWNFSQLYYSGGDLVQYRDPVSASSSSMYPQANVLQYQSGTQKFFKMDNSGIKLMTPTTVTSTSESMFLPLPFSYGSAYTETVINSYLIGSDLMQVTATKTLNGTGTGTLMLPTGTYSDVVKISGILVETRTKNGSNDGFLQTYFSYYFSEKISHPLLYTDQKFDGTMADYMPNTFFVNEIIAGLPTENTATHLSILPNPSSDKIHIQTSDKKERKIILSSLTGEVVAETHHFGETELDVRTLAEGIYILRIILDGRTDTKKIVIAR